MIRTLKKLLYTASGILFFAGSSFASSDTLHPRQANWSFDGIFGSFDRQSAQRGYQVYKEVCSACHAMKLISFRNLKKIGFSEEEVKAIAAEYTVTDGPNADGDMFERSGRPSDRFPSPFANEEAARASNGGAYPLDLSLIVKARPDGANYIYSLLTGYQEVPEHVKMADGMHYNPYFAGGQIAMPAPLSNELVSYQDGTNASVDQMARDVVNFLQ